MELVPCDMAAIIDVATCNVQWLREMSYAHERVSWTMGFWEGEMGGKGSSRTYIGTHAYFMKFSIDRPICLQQYRLYCIHVNMAEEIVVNGGQRQLPN